MNRLIMVAFSGCLLTTALLLTPAAALDKTDRAGLLRWTAALSDDRPVVHNPAISGLRRYGSAALPELSILARDSRAELRLRVALVLAGIPHQRSIDNLLLLGQDGVSGVREAAALALSRQPKGDDRVLERLRLSLQDPAAEVREAAALALGFHADARAIPDLTRIDALGGATARLVLPLGAEGDRQSKRIEKAMRASLQALVEMPQSLSTVEQQLAVLQGPRLLALVQATTGIGDTRLSPILAKLLDDSYHQDVRVVAARSLILNGDSRAIPNLVQQASLAATGNNWRVSEAAATTLRALTGHQAAAGSACLWWQQQADQVTALHRRDAFLAQAHDPRITITAQDMAEFSAQELWPLMQAVLGEGAPVGSSVLGNCS